MHTAYYDGEQQPCTSKYIDLREDVLVSRTTVRMNVYGGCICSQPKYGELLSWAGRAVEWVDSSIHIYHEEKKRVALRAHHWFGISAAPHETGK